MSYIATSLPMKSKIEPCKQELTLFGLGFSEGYKAGGADSAPSLKSLKMMQMSPNLVGL